MGEGLQEGKGHGCVALGNRLVLLLGPQDSAKLSTLLSAQQTLLQALQEMR